MFNGTDWKTVYNYNTSMNYITTNTTTTKTTPVVDKRPLTEEARDWFMRNLQHFTREHLDDMIDAGIEELRLREQRGDRT